MNKETALKKIKELEEYVKGCEGNVWIPKENEDMYYILPDNSYSLFTFSSRSIQKISVQNIYKNADDMDANRSLQRHISDIIKKYGWIEGGDFYWITLGGSWNSDDTDLSSINIIIAHQRSGLVMHKNSTKEERVKMIELIEKANEYLTK